MPKRRPDLKAMTPAEAKAWVRGKTISEVVAAMGVGPREKLAVVSWVPRNGNFNRCSICKTVVTEVNVIGHPMMVTILDGGLLHCSVLVCSEECEGRLHAKYK